LLSLQAQPAPWLRLVSLGVGTCVVLVSVNCATPFHSEFGSDLRVRRAGRDLAYAPTEFYHCQHCDLVWHSVGFGQRFAAFVMGSSERIIGFDRQRLDAALARRLGSA
jgi:hypothetical protein